MPDTNTEQAVGFVGRRPWQIEANDFGTETDYGSRPAATGVARCRFDEDSQDEVGSRAHRTPYSARTPALVRYVPRPTAFKNNSAQSGNALEHWESDHR
jgi:hypothetical protein